MKVISIALLLAVVISQAAQADEGKRIGSIIGLDKAQKFACKATSDYKVVAWAHERAKKLSEEEAHAADEMSKKTFRDMTKSLGKLSTYQEGSLQANMVRFLCRTIDSVLAKAEEKHLGRK